MDFETFAGTHPFRPQHLVDAIVAAEFGDYGQQVQSDEQIREHAARLVELVDAGRCPRCGAALPTLPEFPAGSQVTDCRCIPICARCGRDEAILWLMWVKKEGGDWPSPDARDWPIPEADVLRRLKWSEDNSTRVMIEAGDLDLPESTSGWAAFGYDDTEDRDERGR